MTPSPDQLLLHATAVAVDDQAVLIEGASGSGKSALALTLMAFGAVLVADDRVLLRVAEDGLIATPPATIAGRIEARGVGILRARHREDVRVALAVDLDQQETDRLPPRRSKNLLGISIPVLHNSGTAHFAPSILQYLRGGREA